MWRINAQDDQFFPWGAVFEVDVGLLAEEVFFLVELDESVEANFLRPVFWRVFATPGAVAFFQAQAHECAGAHWTDIELRSCFQQSAIKRDLVFFGNVDLVAEIPGEAHAQHLGVQPGDRHLARTHEAEVLVADVFVGQTAQQLTRRRSSHVKAGPAAGHALERYRLRLGHRVEVAAMVAFGHAGADHEEMLFAQHGDGEVTRDPATHGQQRRQARLADFDRHAVGDDLVEPLGSTSTFDLVFAEVGHVDDANAGPQRTALFADMLPPALAFKAVGLCLIHARRRVPKRMLPAVVEAKDGAEFFLYLIGRAGADRAAGLAFFEREVNGETRAVGFQRPGLGEGFAGPFSIAGHVPGEHVVLRFTVDDPLRQRQPQAAGLRKARNDATSRVVVLQLRHWSQESSRVRGPDHRPVDDPLDPRLAQRR